MIYLWLVCLVALASSGLRADELADEFFDQQIHPILAGKCFRCHGGDRVSAALRVDSRESLLKGGESGPALSPGDAEASLLVKAVRRDEDVSAMPPDKPLRPDEVDALAKWIAAGAVWPKTPVAFRPDKHWAFEPLGDAAVPAVRNESWPRTAIDRFLLAAQEAAGVEPAQPAERRTLLRRMTYDLTGLPATPDEAAAFENDPSPAAIDAAIERLLASPHYGEQWGRRWLDVVRYADTAGENSDHPLPHAWRYRNWVIQAFNDDKPYDEFIREQIAGDLLAAEGPADKYAERIVATGYLAIARRFGHDIDQDMHLTYEDTIDTLGKSVLGLSLGCCRCHDHKYDPLSTRDYYGLYGIFASTRFPFPGCEPKQQPRDLVPLLTPAEIEQRIKPWQDEIAAIDAELKAVVERQTAMASALRDAAGQPPVVLSSGEIDDGKATEFTAATGPALGVAVKAGDVLLFSISPRGNHGADSTLVELNIATTEGPPRRWSAADLAADLAGDLAAANPHADQYGNARAWCFLDALNGLRLLGESLQAIDGRAELQAWRSGDTPSVFVNKSDQPVKVWTELAPRSFFMHPGPQGPVALAWVSPVEAVVAISGRVADAHPGGSGGVGWKLEHLATAGAGGSFAALVEAGVQLRELQGRRNELAARQPALPVAYAVNEGKAEDARIQRRGEPTDLGDATPRKFLDMLGGQSVTETASSGRRELAQWLTSHDNPLTARVMVNRIWQGHFGRGLVATPNDFGTRGAEPSHRELLDYLARAFIDSGWSVKAMHRLILRSAAYQQAASNGPGEPLYAGFSRRRLSAEELRDTLLAVGGQLDGAPGAAHPFPPESSWSFSQHAPFAAEYETAKRSVFVMQKRNRRSRFFALFDGADPNSSTPRRDVTTVPTQALFFMNDPLLHQSAERLAARLTTAAAGDGERIDLACRLLFGRPATEADRTDGAAFLSAYASQLGDPADSARRSQAWTAYARVLLGSNEMIHVD